MCNDGCEWQQPLAGRQQGRRRSVCSGWPNFEGRQAKEGLAGAALVLLSQWQLARAQTTAPTCADEVQLGEGAGVGRNREGAAARGVQLLRAAGGARAQLATVCALAVRRKHRDEGDWQHHWCGCTAASLEHGVASGNGKQGGAGARASGGQRGGKGCRLQLAGGQLD